MKIKFLPNWCNSEEGTKRLFDQFYIDQNVKDIEFVYGDDFDIIFYCGYEQGNTPNNAKKYIFNMEPAWSGNVQRNNIDVDAIIFAQDKKIFTDWSKIIECPVYMFYGAGGEGWTVKDTQVEYEKQNNISCIISSLRKENPEPECLYDKRRAVVDSIINSSVQTDVFGRNCAFSKCMGELPRKIEGLKSYKFSIAIENSREKNYISEKFYDPILTNTIPIYYGAKNIKDVFPENGYFVIEDIENTKQIIELLDYINYNADDLYESMLPELKKIKSRFFKEYNLLTKILEISYEYM